MIKNIMILKKAKDIVAPYLKEDGSLDIERIEKLSLGKYMDVMGSLTQKQHEEYAEYVSQLPSIPGPTPVIEVDEEYEKDIVEKHSRTRYDHDKEPLSRIVSIFLDKHPRTEYYLVNLGSSSEDSECGYYKELCDKEKSIIRKWEENNMGDISLDEYLKSENSELYDRLVGNKSLYALDMIDSCDLNDMVKYSTCQIRQYNKETDEYKVYDSMFPLNDEEFCELLADRICSYHSLTMNSVVVHHPDIAQRIMRYLICLTGMVYENMNPFIVIFTEIDNAFNDILENKDDLDFELRNFISLQSIIGN